MKPPYPQTEGMNPYRPAMALLPFYVSFVVVAVILVFKIYAYAASGSAALLASLIDSAGDGVISLFGYLSVRLSLKPADEEHRFGHGKAEGFSALVQSSFLMGGAIFLVFETVHRFFAPVPVSNHFIAISVSGGTILLSLLVVYVQRYAYKYAPSLALKADQSHYLSDVLVNSAVILALLTDLAGGLVWADMATGLGIGLFIAWTGWQIGRKAIDMLMDREIEEENRQKISEIIMAHPDVKGLHDLRTRRAGMQIYISFDVELAPSLTLEAAHDITRDIDMALLEEFPNAEIIIHKDPAGDTYDPRHKVHGVHM